MDVILLKDVDKVGLRGDVVSVAPGYARNFLLPRRLAEPATHGRLTELRRHEELRSRHEAQSVEQAREIADSLEQGEVRVDVKAGPGGVLFGSVTATTLIDELWRTRRIRVDRRKLDLSEPIKRIGRYEVPVELFTDVTATLKIAVAPEGEELPPEEELPVDEELPVPEEEQPQPVAEEEQPVPEEEQPVPEAVAEAVAEPVPDELPSE